MGGEEIRALIYRDGEFKKDKEINFDNYDISDQNKVEKSNVINQFFKRFGKMLLLSYAGLFGLSLLIKSMTVDFAPTIDYTSFINSLKKEEVDSIEIVKNVYKEISTSGIITYIKNKPYRIEVVDLDSFLTNLEHVQIEQGIQKTDLLPVKLINSNYFGSEIGRILINGIISSLSFLLMYRLSKLGKKINTLFANGQKKPKSFKISELNTRFDDVAGVEGAKLEIKEFVDFLRDPYMFSSVGAKMPKGALLTGSPGTGKTLLAKAAAKESNVAFFAVSGSDFVQKYVGMGAANVRNLFQEARKCAPSIIFIDEIDAIGKKRDDSGMMSNSERDHTLNQLLVEMDGFDSKTSVVVLAATNRPESLDNALTRPGRLDRHIKLSLPDLKARKAIFELYLKKLSISLEKLTLFSNRLATLSPGFSGAEISNLCNEAAILAAREGLKFISDKNFEEASERVIAGLKRHGLLSKEERELVAYHESGHAVAAWFLKGADPLVKLTIIPRSKGSLGYAQYLTNDTQIISKSELKDRLVFVLGGRVAEEIFFNKISTGASDDLQKAFDIATALVGHLGMSDRFSFNSLKLNENRATMADPRPKGIFSNSTAKEIDNEVEQIISISYSNAKDLLKDKKDLVKNLAELLLQKESLSLNDIIGVLGPRPFDVDTSLNEYLNVEQEKNEKQLTI